MRLAALRFGLSHDLPPVVYACGKTLPTAKGSKVLHPASAIPQEWVLRAVNRAGMADNLALVVDTDCTASISPERAEVGHGIADGACGPVDLWSPD